MGLMVARVPVQPPPDRPTWGVPLMSYDNRTCVAGRLNGADGGRSLHLSGHIDVVPAEAPERWSHDPFGATVVGDRLYGRGAGDMKGGLAAYLIATEAFLDVCGAPPGELLFSSVIEEECTGNGMAAVLDAGYRADATLIGEPSGLRLQHAGVGVIWARLEASSGGAHPAFSAGGSSAVRLLDALARLRELETRLNGARGDAFFFEHFDRPFRLNVGELSGGAWPSSEPASASAAIRLGFGRNLSPADAQELVHDAVADIPGLTLTFSGFRAHAYVDDLEHDLASALTGAHRSVVGGEPARRVLAGTTDARWVDGPCVCYGPTAGAIHGTDEWVDIPSLVAVAQVVACTMATWWSADQPAR